MPKSYLIKVNQQKEVTKQCLYEPCRGSGKCMQPLSSSNSGNTELTLITQELASVQISVSIFVLQFEWLCILACVESQNKK